MTDTPPRARSSAPSLGSVRVGIVGLGGIGTRHADNLVDLGATLVGGVDVSPAARERFAETYGVETFESDELLYDAGVDAVIITTPNQFHEGYTLRALDRGVDVLLEKPLAHSLESAERIAAAAESADVVTMIGFHNRFAPGVEVVKGAQREGRFGDVVHVEANYVRRRGIPGRGTWFTSREVSGGGAVIDLGVHAIDLALHFLDFPEIQEVSAATRSEFGSREDYTYLDMWGSDAGEDEFDVEDSATAFIRCADGKTVSLEVAWASNRRDDDEFVITGTEAGASFDRDIGDLTIHETGRAGASHFADVNVETRVVDTHRAELEAFLRSVASGDPPHRNTVAQALTVQRVVEAIYRSAEEGRAVELTSP